MPRKLIDTITISLPTLPPAWEAMRIAHLTDLHIRRDKPIYDSLAAQINVHGADLVLLTGDYMSVRGDEEASDAAMKRLTAALRPKLGVVGVFGNHDTPKLRDMAKSWDVHWLHNSGTTMSKPKGDGVLEVLGYDHTEHVYPDIPATLLNFPVRHREKISDPQTRPFRLLLSHSPQFLPCAGDMDIDLMFSGHTHGGQIRPLGRPWKNACDLPLHLTSGLMRYRNTLCATSRGVGVVGFPPIRWLCPAHVPVYTLRRGAALGQYAYKMVNVRPW